jgi:transposase
MVNGINWIGIDDSADKWTIAQYIDSAAGPAREFELVPSESGYRKLIGWLKQLGGEVRVVYEAGPCGYELYRKLRQKKISCEVVAPSLTPRRPGERVKTNRRDAAKLAKLYRAGELTLIVVPDAEHEAVRDLVRARRAVQRDVLRARQQLNHLLLRHGQRYRKGRHWSQRHWQWVRSIELPYADAQSVLTEMLATIEQRIEQLERYDGLIEAAAKRPQYRPYVDALKTLRGIDTLSALGILSELGDLRRFTTAPQMMAAVGLVPSEYSTGDQTRRFGITKTGNNHVRHLAIEAAWHYRRAAIAGITVQRRRHGQPAAVVEIARRCDIRLNRRFHRLTSRGKPSNVAIVAVARELVGFIWAVGQQLEFTRETKSST